MAKPFSNFSLLFWIQYYFTNTVKFKVSKVTKDKTLKILIHKIEKPQKQKIKDIL